MQYGDNVSFGLDTTLDRGDRMRLPEDELQSLVTQPGNPHIRLVELDGNQQWVVRSLLELHHDFIITDRHARRSVDEVAEQVPRFRRLVTVADPHGQKAVETARHQRQLQGRS